MSHQMDHQHVKGQPKPFPVFNCLWDLHSSLFNGPDLRAAGIRLWPQLHSPQLFPIPVVREALQSMAAGPLLLS